MSIRRRLAAPHPHRTEFLSDSGYALSGREFHIYHEFKMIRFLAKEF
ncbi:MAG: hypothetical protein WCS25_09730 [Victivallaceae bacterium]